MPDMLVKLYELPHVELVLKDVEEKGITIRRALAPEKSFVIGWVRENFGEHWANECDVAFSNHPVSCYIALENGKLVGFACYEATAKNFFGPTGVLESQRGKGVGKALLIACLNDMKTMGYAYAIIGGVGPAEFYSKAVGATLIEGSTPGIYKDMLRSE